MQAGDPYLLLQALAFARRLEQPVNRLGGIGVADEDALDRAHLSGVGRADEFEIGGVGINDDAAAIGDGDAVEGIVDHRLEERASRFGRRQPQDAAGEREQRENADRRQDGEEDEDIGLGVVAAEHHDCGCAADQCCGDEEHQDDAAATRRRAAVDRLPRGRGAGGTLGHALRRHPRPAACFLPCEAGEDEWWCPLRAR